MPTEKAAPHRAKKEKSRVYSFFLLSYTLILLVSLSSCLFFGAEVAQQLRREEALNKQALLTSLKNDVEENLRYVEELGNSLVFNSRLQFLVKHPSVSSVHDAMDQMAGMAVSRDFLLDYFLYVRSTDEVVTSTVRMSADRFFDIIYEFTDLTAQALREGTLAEYHFQDYLPAGGLRQYDSDTVIRVIPYVQSIPISSSAPPPGQVMLLLDSDKFFAHALSLQSATGGSVYVLDETGAAVSQTPDAPGLSAEQRGGPGDRGPYLLHTLCLRGNGLDLLYHVARQSLFYRQPFHHRLPGWCICRIPAAGAVSGAAHRPAQLPPGEGH